MCNKNSDSGIVPLDLKLKWCIQICEAIIFIHSLNVIHYNISETNLLLVGNLDVKMCEFAGSSLNGSENLVQGDTWHTLPFIEDSHGIQVDIFAFGTTIYFIEKETKPY